MYLISFFIIFKKKLMKHAKVSLGKVHRRFVNVLWVTIIGYQYEYFGHLMRGTNSLEKTLIWKRLKAGEEGNDRGWTCWMVSPIQWIWVWAGSGSLWWIDREAWCAAVHGVAKSQTQLSNWTELNWLRSKFFIEHWKIVHLNLVLPPSSYDILGKSFDAPVLSAKLK